MCQKEAKLEEPKGTRKRIMCKECPAYHEPCLDKGGGASPAHWIVIAQAPSGFSVGANKPFYGQNGRLFRDMLSNLVVSVHPELAKLKIYYTYTVLCGPGKPGKDHIRVCSQNLRREISAILGVDGKEPIILALGAAVMRVLGITIGRIEDALGRPYKATLQFPAGPRTFTVVPLLSLDDLQHRPGATGTMSTILTRAGKMALGSEEERKQEQVAQIKPVYEYARTTEEVTKLVDRIIAYSNDPNRGPDKWLISIDTETNTLKMYRPDAKILMLSVAWDTEKAATILLDHPKNPECNQEVWNQVRRLLACAKPKGLHHMKFDFQGLSLKYGIPINNIMWDSMSGEHWLDEDKKGLYGLKKLTPFYVPAQTGYDDELQGILRGSDKLKKSKKEGKKKKSKQDSKGFEDIPLDTVLMYAATDSDVTRQIIRGQAARIQNLGKWEDAHSVMRYLYLPASKTLAAMEYHGFQVNQDYLKELDKNVCDLRDKYLDILKGSYDPTLNYGAPQQISRLMQKLRFEALPGKEFGSTAKDNLGAYATKYGLEDKRGKFAIALQVYRKAKDAKEKIIGKIQDYCDPCDGRVHCSFHPTGTATGRLSSSEPNLQNLPKLVCRVQHKHADGREELIHPGFNFKKLFVPSKPGNILCNVDIAGAELRVYTAYSQDEKMIDMLMNGTDIHSYVTADAYGIPYDKVIELKNSDAGMAYKRWVSKRIIFGTFYGAGPATIARQTGASREEGQRLINMLFQTFPKLALYINSTRREVKDFHSVKTFFGRHRRFKLSGLGDSYFEAACREAINMKIQSTASDLLLSQMCEIHDHSAEIDAELLITVHDSIVMELPEKNIPLLKPFLNHWITERVAEKYKWLPVPLLFDAEVGPNYGELKGLKDA